MSHPFPAESLASSIQTGLQELGIIPHDQFVESSLGYLQRLAEWNKAYNLTAIHDYPRMVSYHLLDSLSILPFIQGQNCVDVGTGPGLPGLILALAEPDRHWLLIDSNRKKIRFVNQVCLDLAIKNVKVVCQRVEKFFPSSPVSTITCRAYARLDKIIRQTSHLLSPDTHLLAMKGEDCENEVQAIDKSLYRVNINTITVPGISKPRTLVEIMALPSPS